MSETTILHKLKPYLEDTPPLLRTPKTVQILILRQTHDYTIFRTEETREINVVVTPRSMRDPTTTVKVAFLSSKQKAPENRMFASLVKHFYRTYLSDNSEQELLNCELKDKLCRKCPRCVLFGAVSTETGGERWNLKHRIEYSTAYSLQPYERVYELQTFNAVEESTQSTGQALGITESIVPIVDFPSVVSLAAVTKEELLMYLKTLLATKAYGAETRTRGDMVNYIAGICAGLEEIITSLEFSLELVDRQLSGNIRSLTEITAEILNEYARNAAFRNHVVVLEPAEVEQLVEYVQNLAIDRTFIKKMYDDAKTFSSKVEAAAKGEDGQRAGREQRARGRRGG